MSEEWEISKHGFEACCRLDKRLGTTHSAYLYAEKRIAELEGQRACSVCAGIGNVFGSPCICNGMATQAAECEGLRLRLYELQQAASKVAELSPQDNTDYPKAGFWHALIVLGKLLPKGPAA